MQPPGPDCRGGGRTGVARLAAAGASAIFGRVLAHYARKNVSQGGKRYVTTTGAKQSTSGIRAQRQPAAEVPIEIGGNQHG